MRRLSSQSKLLSNSSMSRGYGFSKIRKSEAKDQSGSFSFSEMGKN